MRILSINFSHDGAGVILDQGRIAAFVSTERFSRLKKHPGIREQELDLLLDQAGLTLDHIDLVLLVNLGMGFSELSERHGRSLEDTFLRFELNAARDQVSIRGRTLKAVVNPNHFLCHSAAAYYFSPFDQALCFSYDAISSGAQIGLGEKLHVLEYGATQIGDVYTQVSIELGLGGLFGAGKTMGLAPYGRHQDPAICEKLDERARLGSSRFNMVPQLEAVFAASKAKPAVYEDEPKRWDAASAFHVQKLLDLEVDHYLAELVRDLPRIQSWVSGWNKPNLCLSGGTALNSVTNQLIFDSGRFADIYLHPACGDDGTALGAALYYWHHVGGHPKQAHANREAMYSTLEHKADRATFAPYADRIVVHERADDVKAAAELIADGKIVGWFQGASEIGPRALGNRSIVCDPRSKSVRDELNKNVKRRESFRPFAPSVLAEHAQDWFGMKDSPFMLRVGRVLNDKVPAITHVDGSARVQTVERADNPRWYDLIEEFRKLTGVPMVLNTSFNIGGEPIVETPAQAIDSFLGSAMDRLVFPGYVIQRRGGTP